MFYTVLSNKCAQTWTSIAHGRGRRASNVLSVAHRCVRVHARFERGTINTSSPRGNNSDDNDGDGKRQQRGNGAHMCAVVS